VPLEPRAARGARSTDPTASGATPVGEPHELAPTNSDACHGLCLAKERCVVSNGVADCLPEATGVTH
jgi:hypothetical protein